MLLFESSTRLLPRSLASYELLSSPTVSTLMSHVEVLDSSYVLHSLGAAISEPSSPTLHWHRDSDYPFTGVAGSDMPPHAITMLTPMLDMTHEHGPTAFCVGSAHLHGANRQTATLSTDIDSSLLNVMRLKRNPRSFT